MAKILRKSQGSTSKVKNFCWQELTVYHYCIQNVKDRFQLRVCKISKGIVGNFSQSISVKVKKILRKSQTQIRQKL